MTASTKQAADEFHFVAPPVVPSAAAAEGSPVHQVHTRVVSVIERAMETAKTLGESRALTSEGKRLDFSEKVSAPALAELTEHERALDVAAAALEQEAQALAAPQVARREPSDIERSERLALAQAFASRSEQERKDLLDAALFHDDTALAEALAYTHRGVSGIGDSIQRLLREKLEGLPAVDEVKMRDIRARALELRRTRDLLERTHAAVVAASDFPTLQAKGLVPKRARDMTTSEKTAFIEQHGLDAWHAHLDRWR